MRHRPTYLLMTIALASWLLVLPACDDIEPTAEAEWTISVTANPASLSLASGGMGTTTILAVVLNGSGLAQSGIGVRFSADAGNLASGGSIIETNSRGEARDTLTTDQDTIVTVTSGTITGSTTVTVGTLGGPTAVLDVNPPFEAPAGTTVQFSGAASDGDIVEYTFAIVSSNPDAGQPNPDTDSSSSPTINRTYSGAQSLDVTLQVTDTSNLKDSTAVFYDIVANLQPTAAATPSSQNGTVTDPPYECTAQVSACSSTDVDGAIRAHEISWGDGIEFFFQPGPCTFQHTYGATSEGQSMTVTVTVHDDGDRSTVACTSPASQADLTACPSRLSDQATVSVFCAATP